jgi:riboflavin biosynthesis pyrimidine reductase
VRVLLPVPTGEPDLESIYALPPVGGGRHLRVNFVCSLDGAIEVGGRSGPLGGPGDKQIFHLLRALTDVVLVGAGTARAERYGPAQLSEERRQARTGMGQRPTPPIAVVTGRGLDPDSRLFSGGPEAERPLIMTTTRGAESTPKAVRQAADVIACGDERVEPARVIDALTERGLARVLCEGGPSLVTDLFAHGLVDELCLTLAPVLAGPERARLTTGTSWMAPHSMSIGSVLEQDGDLYLRYTR